MLPAVQRRDRRGAGDEAAQSSSKIVRPARLAFKHQGRSGGA